MSECYDGVIVGCESVAAGRAANEDRCCAEVLDRRNSLWGFRAVLVVADGMGGHERGELAAQMAVDTAMEVLASRPEDHARFDVDFLGADTAGVVRRVFDQANERIWEQAQAEGLAGNMGTTLTLVVLDSEGAVVGHVGDSKAYVVSGAGIEKLTEEHSWVGEMVREGAMSEEEAARSPLRSHLTQAVGAAESVEPYIRTVPVRPGDALVVCSDGLTEVVSPEEIQDTVLAAMAPDEACRRLVRAAVEGGARDNVTGAMMVLPGSLEATAPAAPSAEEQPAPAPGEAAAASSLFPELGLPAPAREAEREPAEKRPLRLSSEPVLPLDLGPVAGQAEPAAEAPPSAEQPPTGQQPLAEDPPAPEPPSAAEESCSVGASSPPPSEPASAEQIEREPLAAREARGSPSVVWDRAALLAAVCVIALVAGLFAGKRLARSRSQPAVAPAQGTRRPAPAEPRGARSPVGSRPAATGAGQAGGVFVLETSCRSAYLELRSSEPVSYQVYARGTNKDLLPEQGAEGEERFRLPKQRAASWESASVRLDIQRLGGGRIGITPTPADLRVFVDKKPYTGAALQSIAAKGQHARIGFYFPPGAAAGGYGIVITDFVVGTEQPNGADAVAPAEGKAAP